VAEHAGGDVDARRADDGHALAAPSLGDEQTRGRDDPDERGAAPVYERRPRTPRSHLRTGAGIK
jgi:hypothetical protein